MVYKNRLIEDAKVYYYYLMKHTGQKYQIGRKFLSPLRYEEEASFSTKQLESGKIIWRDFGLGDGKQKGTDCVSLVCHLYDLEYRSEAKEKIYQDVVLGDTPIPEIKSNPPSDNKDYILETHPLKDYEFAYWKPVNRATLDFFRVRGVTYCEMKGIPQMQSFEAHPTFAYIYGEDSFQLYRPSQHRFKSWNIYNTLFGWNQLPETGELLIITSSMKDVITLYELGLTAIAPSSEGAYNYLLTKREELEERFNNILVLYDADVHGVGYAEHLEDKTGWEVLFPVYPRGLKDPSDVAWKYDLAKLSDTLSTARNPILNKYL